MTWASMSDKVSQHVGDYWKGEIIVFDKPWINPELRFLEEHSSSW